MLSKAESALPVALLDRMRALGLSPADFVFSFARSGGPGGQHVNKVSTAALVRHIPSGAAAKCSTSRSQHANRIEALERLVASFETARSQAALEKKAAAAKKRRQRARRAPGTKAKLVETKRHRGAVKALRARPSQE